MIELIVAIMLGSALTAVCHGLLRAHKSRTALLKVHRTNFFDAANRLLTEGTLTDSQLDRLQHMTNDIDKPETFGVMVKAVKEVRKDIRRGNLPVVGREDTSDEWGHLVLSYLLSITYMKPIRGLVLRATLADVLTIEPSTKGAGAMDRRMHLQMA